jgi:hypothetical protein
MRDPHLDKLIQDLKTKKFREGEAKDLTKTYGEEISKQLKPLFSEHSKAMTESVAKSLSGLKMPDMPLMPEQQIPEIPAPIVNVPAPIVNVPAPIVNVPAPVINIPETKFPEQQPFPTSFKLDGVNKLKPLPVMMVDSKGNPAQFPTGGGSSGPGFPMEVLDHTATNPALRVTGTLSISASNSSTQSIDSSGNPYSQANPFPVVFSSTGTTATALVDSSGVAYSGSNPFPTTASVSLTLPSGPGDGATATRFIQAGDSVSSTNILQINGNTPATGLNETTNGVLRIVSMSDTVDSTNVVAFNGNAPATGLNETTNGVLRTVQMTDSVASVVVNSGTITAVTGITNSIAAVMLDRDGNPLTTGPIGNGDQATALRVVHAGDATVSVNIQSGTVGTVTSLTNFNGNAISTNQGATSPGTLRVVIAGDSSSSTSTAGDVASGTADSGNPVKIGAVAHTANPTAVTDGQRVNASADKLGRLLSRPVQVRDLILTAYATVSTGTEATLLTAAVGTFADLIMITATNQSTVATQLDIRAVSGGNIIHTMFLPAQNGPVGWSLSVPWPQDATGNAWTVDLPDITGTTVNVSALFSKEI